MGAMDMTGTQPAGLARPADRPAAMADMPGMKMPAAETSQKMPKGMDMSSPTSPKLRNKMPGMADMPGMNSPSAGAKKPGKIQSGMDDMPNMPGMKSAPAAPAMSDMKDMPGMEKSQVKPDMGSMPGMAMPNPLDQFRFKDNNPARNQPTPKQ